MKRPNLLAVVLFALTAPLSWACTDGTIDITIPGVGNPGTTTREFSWSGALMPGQQLEIKGIAGHMSAIRSSTGLAEVSAVKQANRSNPDEIVIQVVPHAGGVTICAVFPAPPGRPANSCAPGDGGVLHTRNNYDGEVHFTVLVPPGVDFVGKTITGDVNADDMASDVFASSVTGSVRIGTLEMAQASTITGSVTVSLGAADWDRDLSFGTITGDVFLEIPAETNAHVDITVQNGRIESDFVLHETSPGRRQGTIGSGGPDLTLSSVTGNVTLRRR